MRLRKTFLCGEFSKVLLNLISFTFTENYSDVSISVRENYSNSIISVPENYLVFGISVNSLRCY